MAAARTPPLNLRVEAGFSRPGGGLKAAATAGLRGGKPLHPKKAKWGPKGRRYAEPAAASRRTAKNQS